MTNPLLIDPRSSALLVMDYQIDVLEKFMAPADSTEVLSVLPKLLAAARSADMLVIYVVVSFRPGYPEVSPRNAGLSVIAQNGLFQAGSSGTQIHPAVAPIEREPVVIKIVSAPSVGPISRLFCDRKPSKPLCSQACIPAVLSSPPSARPSTSITGFW
jgi:hypothetical protein